jgi:ABC-type transporter Mla subunit MlaD
VRLWTSAAMATLVLSTLACRDRDRDETASRVDTAVSDVGDEARGGAAEARDEVREGARSLDSYTWAERDDFRRDVRQRLTDIDGQIEQLSNDARSSGGTVDDQSMADIRRARKAVDRNVAKLDEATENSWPDLRAGIDRSLETLRDRVDQVTRTGGPMGGRSPGQS